MAANSGNFSSARPSPSVFDTYNRGIRGNTLRGTSAFIDNWSNCDTVLRRNRFWSYVTTLLLVLVFCAVLLQCSFGVIVTLLLAIMGISIYNNVLVSQKFCFNVLGTA